MPRVLRIKKRRNDFTLALLLLAFLPPLCFAVMPILAKNFSPRDDFQE